MESIENTCILSDAQLEELADHLLQEDAIFVDRTTVESLKERNEKGYLFVVRDANVVVACGILWDMHEEGGVRAIELGTGWIQVSYRGKNLFPRVIEVCIEHARKEGFETMVSVVGSDRLVHKMVESGWNVSTLSDWEKELERAEEPKVVGKWVVTLDLMK